MIHFYSEQKRRAKAAKKAEEKAAKEQAQAAQKAQQEATQKPKKENEEDIKPNVNPLIYFFLLIVIFSISKVFTHVLLLFKFCF